MKDKTVAAILAFFLGAFGVHRFYLGDSGAGCMYLLFSWTGIPQIAAIIEGIMYLLMSQAEFDRRYNRVYGPPPGITVHTVTTHTTIEPSGRVYTEQYQSQTVQTPQYAPQGRPASRPSQRTAGQPEYRTRAPRSAEERERFVLQAARDNGGVLTPTDLALMTQISLRDARDALEALRDQLVCHIDIDVATGNEQYVFPDFLPERQPERLGEDDVEWLDDDLRAR